MFGGEINECRAGACSRRVEHIKFNERDVRGIICKQIASPTVLNDCQFAYRRKIRSDFVVVGDGALDVPRTNDLEQ